MSSSSSNQFGDLKIPLRLIKLATNNFSDEKLIRRGGFGKIYKAQLRRSGKVDDIVVRRLDPEYRQGQKEFLKELSQLAILKHDNLVSIIGYCDDEEGEKIIINKYETHGSLDKHLKDPTLTWMRRLEICVSVARALCYIHYDNGRDFSVIHKNIKSSKILLDDNWNPKLSGFELSVTNPNDRRHRLRLDRLSGTIGYIDPRYEKTGGVTHKSDVYSFGVVLFEVLCGRRAFDNPEWISAQLEKQDLEEKSLDKMIPSPKLAEQDSTDSDMNLSQGSGNYSVASRTGSFTSLAGSNGSNNSFEQAPSFTAVSKLMESQQSINPEEESKVSTSRQWSTQQRPPLNPQDMCMFTLAPSARFHYEERFGHVCIPEEELLAPLAVSLYKQKRLYDLIDPDLRKSMDPLSLDIFSKTAYDCLNDQRADRPDINQILIRLQEALNLQWKYENPGVSTEHSSSQAQGASTNRSEWKNLEHLKISFREIEEATKKFSQCIGKGGYGKVYKAELEHFDCKSSMEIEGKNIRDLPKIRSTVAIKCLLKRNDTQAEEGFSAEIQTLTSCKHPNIVSLLGFCDEESSDLILVYEFVANGSLDSHLRSYDKMINLKWEQRLQLCLDIAQGLNYLHTEKNIIHRDIKSDNILLDENLVAKIADFGLSKIIPMSQQASYLETKVAGTNVYLDPEYLKTNRLKKASDIYSLGVVFFEILSGKLAYNKVYTKDNDKGLAPFVLKHFKNGTLKDMLDPKLKEEFDESIFTLSKGPNQDSLETFLDMAYQCIAEIQAERPKVGTVVEKLKNALQLQKNHKDKLQISLKDIQLATSNFDKNNHIGRGGFGKVYRGEVTSVDGRHTTIAAKRLNTNGGQGETEFLTELEILLEYKNRNVIGLLGYCNEPPERIIVYEYASRGSLDRHLGNKDLTWRKRLEICIDIARGLDFLHGGGVRQEVVMHRDIKSANILLCDDWRAKISDFGLSAITSINEDVIDNACGTKGYCDPHLKNGVFTKASDIYSFGVLLFEILCGRLMLEDKKILINRFKRYYKEGTLDDKVFEGIKEQIAPQSSSTFQKLANECVDDLLQNRPTTSDVLKRLEEALESQDDHDTWTPKLPHDYEQIFKMSKESENYLKKKKEDLHDMLSKGILLKKGKAWFTLGTSGERNQMISAKAFSYINDSLRRWRSIKESRFQEVAEMLDVLNLNMKFKTQNQRLSPNVVYGIYLIFKFCDPRKNSTKPLYVNLKYRNGSESTLHAYFATWRDNEWMMIELWRFLNDREDITFEFILDNFSQCSCGDGTIYIEGIEFRAIAHVNFEETSELKKMQQVLKSNSNMELLQEMPTNYQEILMRIDKDDGEKEVNRKKHGVLSSKATLISYNPEHFQIKSSTQSRFPEAIELLPQQVFRISCAIKSQILIRDTDYMCYLVFTLSETCQGLYCPIKVRELLHSTNNEDEIVYLRSPSPWNLHDTNHAPKKREDGWMEVNVWKFNLSHEFKDNDFHLNLRFVSYEGTMSGLIVGGLEFRSM